MEEQIKQTILDVTQFEEDVVDEIFSKGQKVFHKPGNYLTTTGQPCEFTYFAVEGLVKEYYAAGPGTQHITRLYCAPGPYTPSLSDFVTQRPAFLSSQVISPFAGMRWHHQDFFEFADKYPRLYKFYFEGVTRAVHAKEFERKQEGEMTTKQRYLDLLERSPLIAKVVSVKDIASYLGVSRETISRIRSQNRK